MMTKIGIMGGTFDPIHYGHLIIAENACEQFQLDQIIFLPAGQPPMKDATKVSPAEHRLHMTELAIADNPHFVCSDYEFHQQGVSYTYRTLAAFHERYPKSELSFIMGADELDKLKSWKKPQQVFDNCTILAAVRDGLQEEGLYKLKEDYKKRYDARVEFIRSPNNPVSSSMLRERVRQQRSVRYMLPPTVESYIQQHGLYRNRN